MGENEPYSGAELNATMNRHAEAHGRPYMFLEIRQDLIGDDSGVDSWVERLAPILMDLTGLPELHQVQLHGSRVV